jgi:hypothetical protein
MSTLDYVFLCLAQVYQSLIADHFDERQKSHKAVREAPSSAVFYAQVRLFLQAWKQHILRPI